MASTSPEAGLPPARTEELSGWGCTPVSAAAVVHPALPGELRRCLDDPPPRGAIARGLGRAYGDAATNAGGRVIDTTATTGIELDAAAATVTAAAGTSLEELMRVLVPRGFFVPVSPGTRQVTVGGAIASDIHGKNHHVDGSFGDHVRSLRLLVPGGEVLDVGPDTDPELFWATTGGMGLTGVVLDATFSVKPIETSRLVVDTFRCPDLDTAVALMSDDDRWPYTVCWIDLMARGRHLGRSVLTAGRFARPDELTGAARSDPLGFDPELLVIAPPLVPNGLLNRFSIRAFNELWYRKAPVEREGELQTISQFWHPLDLVGSWNRMYGPSGFLQWQPVLPIDRTDVLREICERLAAAQCTSIVNVLKRFGPGNPGPLSFPMAGWTLSVDIAAGVRGLPRLLDELDALVADAGGRLYLAKDSRLRAEVFAAMYPRLDEWRAVRDRVDPDGVLRSDLGRRLDLC